MEERKSRYELWLEEEEKINLQRKNAPVTVYCPKCQIEKSITEFHRNKNSKNGLQSHCKTCRRKGDDTTYKNREDRFWKTFWAKVIKSNDCLEWQGAYKTGTPVVSWYNKQTNIRSVIFKLRCGEIPEGNFVITKCQNRRCVRESHLILATKDEVNAMLWNNMSKWREYASPSFGGKRNRFPKKITDEIVQMIRDWHRDGLPHRVIAERLSVGRTTVRDIVMGRRRSVSQESINP